MTHTILIPSDQNTLSMGDPLTVVAIERGVMFGEELVDIVRVEPERDAELVSKTEVGTRRLGAGDSLMAKRLDRYVSR